MVSVLVLELVGGCMLILVWESMGSLLPFRFSVLKEKRRKESKDTPSMLWIAFTLVAISFFRSPRYTSRLLGLHYDNNLPGII